MRHTALIRGDQLMSENPALDGAQCVLLLEPLSVFGSWLVHRRRAHVVLSAIRHFVSQLEQRGELQVLHRREVASFAEGPRDAALREAGRVAKPSAPVVIQVWGPHERNDLEATKEIARPFMPPRPSTPHPSPTTRSQACSMHGH